MKIAVLAGDGIGPEIVAEALKLVDCLRQDFGFAVEVEHGLIGGAAVEATGWPLPERTLKLAQQADAVLLGAVGGPQWDSLERERRPEQGLLGLRAGLGLFANLRPAVLYPELAEASTLKPAVVSGLDILIVRELTGGIYFGQPRGIRRLDNGERQGFNTLVYSESEIRRIGRVAFEAARTRNGRLCSVDKANVLEATDLWRQVITELHGDYRDVALTHMYVDNAAMQLIRAPKQFDVIVTTNMFGDILSDCAAMLTGSIGMLPSASLDAAAKGMYEPVHGSAPDIAGSGVANPLATLLSVAMMLRYSLGQPDLATRLDGAVRAVLKRGLRTADLWVPGAEKVGTRQMGDAVLAAFRGH
jgi:3-isopropylmalate dehydrogenase